MQGPPPPPREEPRGIPWSLVGIALLAVYALLIVLLNRDEVAINFVFFSTRISKLVLILLCLGLGFAAGYLLDRWRDRGRSAS